MIIPVFIIHHSLSIIHFLILAIDRNTIDHTVATPQGTAAYHLVEKLMDAGFDAWWVGGCVRDMLLEKIPEDVDIGTNATPEQIQKLLTVTDASAIIFGSLRVKERGVVFEVTTFREDDEESDGRHPESIQYSDREHDAPRRDITINALYWHPVSRALYDPFGGEEDLHEGLIRIIGDPDTRIAHDALRLLRVVRFRALINGQYHPATFQALHRNAQKIDTLSGVRQFTEFEKMLCGPHPDRALEDLWETDILEVFLPELHACKGVAQPKDFHHEGDVWDHMMGITRAFTEEHDADCRLAALFHDCGKAQTFGLEQRIRFDEHASASGDLTDGALRRLQCPAQRREKIVWIVRHHMMMQSFFTMSHDRKAHWYYHPWFTGLMALFWLDIAGTEPRDFGLYEKIRGDYHQFLDQHPIPPRTLVSGHDVMRILGLPSGSAVGEILRELYGKQLLQEITSKKEAYAFLEAKKPKEL